ncbi:MAG: hypothetical protein JJ992_09820, partial [Planctomycetes bacterium]|nr:hypothetical protein [Planctomycetota bacterium]
MLLLLLLAGGFTLWAGWNPPVPDGPVRLVRNSTGQFEQQPGETGPHWEAHAGKIQAQNSITTISSESRSGRARFACRRMLIVNRSEHLLMQRVGARLLDHLKTIRGFEQVDYLPDGRQTETGQVSPDVTVTLELEEIQESGLVAAHQLEARIRMQAGNSLRRSSTHYMDGLDPPLVNLDIACTLEHRSTTTEIGTPSSRYKLAAEDIAKQLGEALAKKLNELYEKDGALPPLPDVFY